MKITAPDMLKLGLIDGIIAEPGEGAQTNADLTAEAIRETLRQGLAELAPLSPQQLKDQRYQKFRAMGACFTEAAYAGKRS